MEAHSLAKSIVPTTPRPFCGVVCDVGGAVEQRASRHIKMETDPKHDTNHCN